MWALAGTCIHRYPYLVDVEDRGSHVSDLSEVSVEWLIMEHAAMSAGIAAAKAAAIAAKSR